MVLLNPSDGSWPSGKEGVLIRAQYCCCLSSRSCAFLILAGDGHGEMVQLSWSNCSLKVGHSCLGKSSGQSLSQSADQSGSAQGDNIFRGKTYELEKIAWII